MKTRESYVKRLVTSYKNLNSDEQKMFREALKFQTIESVEA